VYPLIWGLDAEYDDSFVQMFAALLLLLHTFGIIIAVHKILMRFENQRIDVLL
jgi:hypothetical protein